LPKIKTTGGGFPLSGIKTTEDSPGGNAAGTHAGLPTVH
jgi:hypothetical protein